MAAFDLTLDADDAGRLAEFWKLVLGYEDEPPPAPYATRADWLAALGEPEGTDRDGAWLRDPTGVGPRLSILRVPEPKTAKNRLHLDVRVANDEPPDRRWATIEAAVERFTAAGATTIAVVAGHHVVLADPEGNEFCVA